MPKPTKVGLKYKTMRILYFSQVPFPALFPEQRGIQIKIAGKTNTNRRQKRKLDDLYEVPAPGSTVGKVSPTTSFIKEPKKAELCVKNIDIAKFGTKE